jgi:branched-chain amino acid transport system permease protein
LLKNKTKDQSFKKGSNLRIWFYVFCAVLIGLYIALPFVVSAYLVSVIFMLFVYIAYAEGWNIMSGLTGYVNFGYSMFSGIAGYLSVILIIDLKIWWPVSWLLGGISASIAAIILGGVMLRLRGSYFAIGMLALLLGIKLLSASKYLAPITRGGYGFAFLEPVSMNIMYYSAGVVAFSSIFICHKIVNSSFGARLLAIREDEEAAGSLGINATIDKITAFAISAFVGGLMGTIHVAFSNYLEPDTAFNMQWTIVPIVMVLLGGPGTVWGPVVGAIILTFVEELFWAYFPGAYMMIYALVMAILVLCMPKGIVESLKSAGIFPKTRAI